MTQIPSALGGEPLRMKSRKRQHREKKNWRLHSQKENIMSFNMSFLNVGSSEGRVCELFMNLRATSTVCEGAPAELPHATAGCCTGPECLQ